mmetsp:Transcript_50689/g.121044  ORF Transcript_50689/g.121044 Transcript_50689/m.121044 type:complete len:291 (-) Transcript_50689:519-1391(-)
MCECCDNVQKLGRCVHPAGQIANHRGEFLGHLQSTQEGKFFLNDFLSSLIRGFGLLSLYLLCMHLLDVRVNFGDLLVLLCSRFIIDDGQHLGIHLLEFRLGLRLATGLGQLQNFHSISLLEGGVAAEGVQAKNHFHIIAPHDQLLLLHSFRLRVFQDLAIGDRCCSRSSFFSTPLSVCLLLLFERLGIRVCIALVVRLVHHRDGQKGPKPCHVKVMHFLHISDTFDADGVVRDTGFLCRWLPFRGLFGYRLYTWRLPKAKILEIFVGWIFGKGAPGDSFALSQSLLRHPL